MKYENPATNEVYRKLALAIGKKIKARANEQGLTITDLALKAGVSQGNLHRMAASGESCLQLLALYKVARALNVGMERILVGVWE